MSNMTAERVAFLAELVALTGLGTTFIQFKAPPTSLTADVVLAITTSIANGQYCGPCWACG